MITTPVACVVDASVGIKLVITEPLSSEAHALFAHLVRDPSSRFVVPELFDIECANILWKHIQRSGYPLVDAQSNLATLMAWPCSELPSHVGDGCFGSGNRSHDHHLRCLLCRDGAASGTAVDYRGFKAS
jgi:hypothetical protein